MRDVDAFWNSADRAQNRVESAMQSEFFALATSRVHAQAYTQRRSSAADLFDERLDQTELGEVVHRVAKRADAGEEVSLAAARTLAGVGCHFDFVPEDGATRIFDAAKGLFSL